MWLIFISGFVGVILPEIYFLMEIKRPRYKEYPDQPEYEKQEAKQIREERVHISKGYLSAMFGLALIGGFIATFVLRSPTPVYALWVGLNLPMIKEVVKSRLPRA